MSDLDDPDVPDDDLLAAEYALGVLDGAARGQVERRMRRDEPMARAVAEWEGRLAPMLASIEPVAPPAGLWNLVETDLLRIARVRSSLAAGEAAPPPRGRQVAGFWQWLGLGSVGLLAASLAALVVALQPLPQAEPLAALLAGENGPPLYTAVVYPGARSATLVPVSVSSDAEHSHELWLIEADKDPRSLGVIAAGGPLRIEIPPELLASGGILAISLEPVGGSPTGKPTGPVVAKGELQAI